MVFGPILDARQAQREGKSLVSVWNRGQQLINAGLPMSAKLGFWSTNLPYYLLAARLWVGGEEVVAPGAQWAHALVVTVVAVVSTAFHGAALFGSGSSPWPARLLLADLTCANGYGIVLACNLGFFHVLRIFMPGVICLATGAYLKRRGSPFGYVLGHGIWHLLSTAVMYHCLFNGAGI